MLKVKEVAKDKEKNKVKKALLKDKVEEIEELVNICVAINYEKYSP